MKILLADDDRLVADKITTLLTTYQYVLDWAIDAETALMMIRQFEYDLILLDIMLPDGDGREICRQVRQWRSLNTSTPILLLTAKDKISDRVAGLNAGADDYLVKPYHPDELLARIQALLRRQSTPIETDLQWSQLHLNSKTAEVTYKGKLLHLTPKEYRLLELFLRHPHQLFSPRLILDWVWSIDESPTEDAVRTQIKGLRHKLKAAGLAEDPIETVYGFGYRLKPVSSTAPESNKSIAAAQAKILATVAQTWQQYQWQIGVAVEQFERIVEQMESKSVDKNLCALALRHAHRLVGTLGSLGHTKGSNIARGIEQYLEQQFTNDPQILRSLVNAFTQAVRVPPEFTENSFLPSIDPITSYKSKKILLLENHYHLTQQLQAAASWDIAIDTATKLTTAQKYIQRQGQDYSAAILDLDVVDSCDEILDWLRQLRQDFPQLPVMVLGSSSDLNLRVRVAKGGATVFLSKPVRSTEILEALTKILPSSKTKTVLAVDDDLQFLDILRERLASKPFQLQILNDPTQFWQVLEATNPDLVLLDVEMPHFKGTDLCQALRLDYRWRDLPILAISAYRDRETLTEILTAGFTDYLSKTEDLSMLVAYLERCWQRSQLI